MTVRPLVAVVISSRTDFNVMRRGLEALRVMGVPYQFEVISPHRSPERIAEFARAVGEHGGEVIIAAAGGSPLLATHLASHTNLPVIGVPIDATPLRGQDALFSLSMVPAGMPIATVGINNSENAAVLATQILALKHPQFRTVLAHRHMSATQRAESLQKDLLTEYADLCSPERTVSSSVAMTTENETEPGDLAESPTPDPGSVMGPAARIQPGAIFAERPGGTAAQSLVSTPVPQEPGGSESTAAARVTAESGGAVASADTPPVEADEPAPPHRARPRVAAREEIPESPRPVGSLQTKVFTLDREDVNDDLIDHVMMVLLEGGIVGIPTDTVYGLAADATNPEAIERLCALKGREHQKTLGVLIHHPEMLDQLVREIPPGLDAVLEECWPGALTVVLYKKAGILSAATKSDRIGVRMPSDPVCLAVIERIGRPIVMRNASFDPNVPMTHADGLMENYGGHIDCILDAGECETAQGPSTVLSAVGEQFEILREGGVRRDKLKELLGERLKDGK